MADKITLTGPKKIQVNDNEYITFDSRDRAFMDGLLELVQDFEEHQAEYQAQSDKIGEHSPGAGFQGARGLQVQR